MKNDNACGLADLHIHTNYSDGTASPEEVVRQALDKGLKAIAITDHDSVGGIGPAIDEAKGTSLEVIPGIELSVTKNENEIHILGYFIDWHDPEILAIQAKLKENRLKRMKKMLELLSDLGIDIDLAKVSAPSQAGLLGRLHLARVMAEEGIVRNTKEAFDKYIGDNKPASVRHEHLDYRAAIGMIKRMGGVSVLAHPGGKGKDEDIPLYVEAGLDGIEVYHEKHKPYMVKKYLKLTEKYNLVATGGSDYHGESKDNAKLGEITVGYEAVEALRARARSL